LSGYTYNEIDTELEKKFNTCLQAPEQRNGKFKEINDYFYESMEKTKILLCAYDYIKYSGLN